MLNFLYKVNIIKKVDANSAVPYLGGGIKWGQGQKFQTSVKLGNQNKIRGQHFDEASPKWRESLPFLQLRRTE